jgi:hypothetical protein
LRRFSTRVELLAGERGCPDEGTGGSIAWLRHFRERSQARAVFTAPALVALQKTIRAANERLNHLAAARLVTQGPHDLAELPETDLRDRLACARLSSPATRTAGHRFIEQQRGGSTMLDITSEKLGYIIEKARELESELAVGTDAFAPNPAIDDERESLEDSGLDPTLEELRGAIECLNADEQEELVALVWVGRGDFSRAEWPAALQEARRAQTRSAAEHLIGTPLLADYLEEGAAAVGLASDDTEGDYP